MIGDSIEELIDLKEELRQSRKKRPINQEEIDELEGRIAWVKGQINVDASEA